MLFNKEADRTLSHSPLDLMENRFNASFTITFLASFTFLLVLTVSHLSYILIFWCIHIPVCLYKVLIQADICSLANLVSRFTVWYTLYHTTLEQNKRIFHSGHRIIKQHLFHNSKKKKKELLLNYWPSYRNQLQLVHELCWRFH